VTPDRPIITERLELRALEAGDADGPYGEWVRDPEVTRYLEIRFLDLGRDDLREYIQTMNASSDNLFLGIFLRESDKHIGNIKLGPVIAAYKRAELGLMIGAKATWGKGYGTESIEAVSRYGFDVLGLHKIVAGCYSGNVASAKAFLKLGFVKEGVQKDHWISDGEWQDEFLLGRVTDRPD
jgi:RimJ/RimL family protein N-acetyltransferase